VTRFNIALLALVAILAAAVVWENQSIGKARDEAQALRQQVDALTPLQAENERLSNAVAQASTSTLEPDQVHELAKLRAEVVRLRTQSSQADAANLRAQKSESEAAALRAQNNDLAKAQADARELNQRNQAVSAQNACINNLRLMDAAKQQWALENKKLATDTPTFDDVRPYLAHGPNGEIPACPSGGAYILGTVSEVPKCSIPGHVLP